MEIGDRCLPTPSEPNWDTHLKPPLTSTLVQRVVNFVLSLRFMPILGIGVDLVHVPRIASLLSRRSPEKFARKILSREEYQQWQNIEAPPQRLRFLAVRWSVKEAAYKAMYPIVRPTWKEITFTSFGPSGEKPHISYHPVATALHTRIGRKHVSVSHDGDYVYSTVLIEDPAI